MQILVKIATFILPVIINFLNKHQSEILEKAYARISKLLGISTDGFEIIVKNTDGEIVPNVVLTFKKYIKDNKVNLENFSQFIISAEGYKEQSVVLGNVDKLEIVLERC